MVDFNYLGSCSHGSGVIVCFGVPLTSGRVAIVTEYEGEYAANTKTILWGTAPNTDWRPRLSAKYGGNIYNREEIMDLSFEEIMEFGMNGIFGDFEEPPK